MSVPLQITYRGFDTSDAVSQLIKERTDKLESVCDRITRCHVTVDAPHRHHVHGNHYRVHIDLVVPGLELVADRDVVANPLHEDLYAAIGDAFDAMKRRLLAAQQRRRNH